MHFFQFCDNLGTNKVLIKEIITKYKIDGDDIVIQFLAFNKLTKDLFCTSSIFPYFQHIFNYYLKMRVCFD